MPAAWSIIIIGDIHDVSTSKNEEGRKKKVFSVRWRVFMNEISSYIALGFDIIFALSVVIDENIHEQHQSYELHATHNQYTS